MSPKKNIRSPKPSKVKKIAPVKGLIKPRIVKKRDGNYPVKIY